MFSNFSRSATAAKVFASSSTPVDEILGREELAEIVGNSDSTGQRHMITYVDKHIAKVLAAQQKDGASDRVVTNACALLVRYLQTHPRTDEAIRRVVPFTIAVFARKGILPSKVCVSVQKVLLAAFDEDFSRTSYSINISLGDEIVHGAIRNLSSNGVVGETLIALFGSALSAATMMMPATTPNIFTDVWIKHGFPVHVASYCRVAMSSVELQPYFLFMQELLKRGLSHSAGPIVDAILQPSGFEPLLQAVVECNESSSAAQQAGQPDDFPLASEGLSLVASSLSLIRKTLPPTESRAQYEASLTSCAPVSLVLRYLPRLVELLTFEETSGASCRRVGLRRLAILDIIVELLSCNVRDCDDVLIQVDAMGAMLTLWKTFPNNDFVGRAVEKALTHIFLRRKPSLSATGSVHEESAGATFDDGGDLFIRCLYFCAPPPVDGEASSTTIVQGCILETLRSMSFDPAFKDSSLQAFALNIVVGLNELTWFSHPALKRDAFFSQVLQVNCAERVHAWMSPITGSAFADPGSGCPLFHPVHRPPSNPMHVDVSQHQDSADTEEEDYHLLSATNTSAVSASSSSSDPQARLMKYSRAEDFDNDGDAQGVAQADAGFHFDLSAEGGDDTVNLDDEDPGDPIEVVKEDSCDRFEDQVWLEQAIQDVSDAVAERPKASSASEED